MCAKHRKYGAWDLSTIRDYALSPIYATGRAAKAVGSYALSPVYATGRGAKWLGQKVYENPGKTAAILGGLAATGGLGALYATGALTAPAAASLGASVYKYASPVYSGYVSPVAKSNWTTMGVPIGINTFGTPKMKSAYRALTPVISAARIGSAIARGVSSPVEMGILALNSGLLAKELYSRARNYRRSPVNPPPSLLTTVPSTRSYTRARVGASYPYRRRR